MTIERPLLVENKEKGMAWYLRNLDVPNDIACVFSTWCNHIRKADPFNRLNPDEFRAHKQLVLERLVVRAPIVVAHYPDHPEQILGWCCCDGMKNLLHFVFVKEAFRGNGIGKSMVSLEIPWICEKPVYCTHKSTRWASLAPAWKLVYNPYLIVL